MRYHARPSRRRHKNNPSEEHQRNAHDEDDMNQRDTEAAARERVIAALAESTARSPEVVRSVFAQEYARLEANAKVRTHLQALTTSNVRAILRGDPQAPSL
jgi:hypothetical protein